MKWHDFPEKVLELSPSFNLKQFVERPRVKAEFSKRTTSVLLLGEHNEGRTATRDLLRCGKMKLTPQNPTVKFHWITIKCLMVT